MAASQTLDPKDPFTPSELVLLHGEMFAKKAMVGNTKLIHSDASVSTSQLGLAILSAAFLGSEQIGAVILEVRQKKAMLGLRKMKGLFADPRPVTAEWPGSSIESQLVDHAQQLQSDQDKHEVASIIYTWLGNDSVNPWQAVIDQVKAGMAERDLLEASEEKRLKVFTVTEYSLPEGTRALLPHQGSKMVATLLERCQKSRSDVWRLLEKQIKSAISRRTESADYD